MFITGCPCCKGCGGFSAAERMVVTLSSLPHENKADVLYPLYQDHMESGVNYLDDYNGQYVLYKSYSKQPVGSTPGWCIWQHSNITDLRLKNQGSSGSADRYYREFEIFVVYRWGGSLGSGGWTLSVDMNVLGGSVTWTKAGSGGAAVLDQTLTSAEVVINESAESAFQQGNYYYPYPTPWNLSSATCLVAEYDQAKHALAAKPCQCLPVVGLGAASYVDTCLKYNGTPAQPTVGYDYNVYNPMENCSPQSSIYCADYVATHTLVPPGSLYGFSWRDYGTDELQLTLSDATTSNSTIPTGGSYILPWNGLYRRYGGGNTIYCGSTVAPVNVYGEPPIQASWGSAFGFQLNGYEWACFLQVRLARVSTDQHGYPLTTASRRLFVNIILATTNYYPSGSGLTVVGSASFRSSGSQGEDSYSCGNMPTVTSTGAVNLGMGCGWPYIMSWEVSQA